MKNAMLLEQLVAAHNDHLFVGCRHKWLISNIYIYHGLQYAHLFSFDIWYLRNPQKNENVQFKLHAHLHLCLIIYAMFDSMKFLVFRIKSVYSFSHGLLCWNYPAVTLFLIQWNNFKMFLISSYVKLFLQWRRSLISNWHNCF